MGELPVSWRCSRVPNYIASHKRLVHFPRLWLGGKLPRMELARGLAAIYHYRPHGGQKDRTMDIQQTTIQEFTTGHGVADATPKPIVAAGYSRKAYKGVTVHCISGTVYVGPSTVTNGNGFELPANEEVLIPVENPSNVYVVGDGNYSWLAV